MECVDAARLRRSAATGGGSDGDRDLSLDRARFEVPHGCGHLVQRVGAVDARGHGSGSDVLGENFAVAGPLLGGQAGQPLPDEGGQQHGPQLAVDAAGDVALDFAADDDRGSGGSQCPAEPGEWGVAGDVDDQVVVVRAVGEVLAGVVDDMVRTQTSYQVQCFGAAHTGDLRAGGLGQLYRCL